MLQLRESDAATPGLRACLSETRIGLFDFSEPTCTGLDALVTHGAHRASIDSCREVTTDLDLYTQADPMESAVFGNSFAYAAANPLTWTDHFGLYHSGDVLYRCPPPGTNKSCDVVTILYDPTPNDDNNGDEMAIAYGNPDGCAAPCTGTAHLTHLNGPTDPYRGYQVRGACSQMASYEEIAKRWGEWRHKNPPWTPMGSPAPSQCFTLANHLTGVGNTGVGFQWGWPPIKFPVDHDLTYWKTRCHAK